MAVIAGISWPFRADKKGIPAQAVGMDVIRSCLVALLKTKKRSRVMRPDVGTNLHRFIFETQGPLLQQMVQKEVFDCITQQIPNITIRGITVFEDNTKIIVNVIYSVFGVLDSTGDVAFERAA